MLKIIGTAAALSLLATTAIAQQVKYSDAVTVCGAEWRERTDKQTNKGRDAWNAFRAECVKRLGFVPQREAQAERVAAARARIEAAKQ